MHLDETIDSISDLVEHLKKASLEEFPILLQKLEVSNLELEEYSHFSPENYHRHCFVETEDYELILMCWDKDQGTPIHNHGNQNCWVKVVSGEIQENRYKKDLISGNLDMISSDLRSEGQVGYIKDDLGMHTLYSPNRKSLSLHLYAKPIKTCKVFNKDGSLVEEKILEPDTVGL